MVFNNRHRRRPVAGAHRRCVHRVGGKRAQPGPAWSVVARRPARPGCAGVWRGVRPELGPMPLSYAAGLLRTYISGAASYLMILWWACLTLVLRMVILRTTRGQDRKRRFGSFCSWISTMVWRTAALSDEGGNCRLVQELAADDVDRAHVGVPVGVGAEFVGRFGDEHLCRVVGDQQSPDLLFHQVR